MADQDHMHVLVVEDDADTRANLRDILELDGYAIETAASIAEALDRDDWSAIGAIILDRKLPDGNAEDWLPQLRQLAPEAAVIVATGFPDLEGAIAAIRNGAADYILKPVNADLLRRCLATIVERKRAERALRETESRFRRLVETARCMIVITAADQTILYFNPFAEQVTGYAAAEVLGKDGLSLLVPDPASKLRAMEERRRVLAGVPTRNFEIELVCRDGSRRWTLWDASALENYQGRPAILSVGQDITELKQTQQRLVQSERLAAIGQMMAGLAHESRNALQRSQACLEMLALDIQDRPEALELVTDIQKAQDYLHHLYEEVRGYAAPITPRREPCHLGELVDELWLDLAPLRQNRTAHLKLIENGLDLHCEVDRHAMGQVFRNILENSLAACNNLVDIEVNCSATEIGDQPGLLVSVRDNGPGLTPEARERVFEPFFTTKTEGTGLGMAIAKRIVEAHGGQIEVGPNRRPGAVILIRLPRSCGAHSQPANSLDGCRQAGSPPHNMPNGRGT